MAPQKKADRSSNRRRNRKARTEVSSDSSSSSSESEAGSPPPSQAQAPAQQRKLVPLEEPSSPVADQGSEHSGSSPEPTLPAVSQPSQSSQQAFEQFYLAQATKEFANDLDKLRNAGDFRGGQSVEVLVRGLRQGVVCFGEGERGRVGGAGGG